MKKSLRCICAAIFALAFCTGFVIHASAVERASSYLTRYSATLFAGDRGAVEITISVVANQRVSELGASYILLEESNDGGRTWSTAKEYEGESWMTAENRSSYSRTLSYQGTIEMCIRDSRHAEQGRHRGEEEQEHKVEPQAGLQQMGQLIFPH